MPSITVVSGPNEGDYYPLGKRTMVVGRDEGATIQVLDDLVSRKHAQIRWDEPSGSYHALDMKSANGTLINGRVISADVQLEEADIVEAGRSKLMFSFKDFPDKESALSHFKKRGERGRSTLLE